MSEVRNTPSRPDAELVRHFIGHRSAHVVLDFDAHTVDYQKDAQEALSRLLAVVNAAKRYRDIGLSDPTSLDLPPAGSELDKALAALVWEVA